MRGRVLGLVLVFALLLACMAGLVRRVDAFAVFIGLPAITIQSDGSVVPQTEYIKQEGNVYKLTADLQQTYVININCSNIVFDGQGHTINGTQQDPDMRKAGSVGYYSYGICLENVANVMVKSVATLGFTRDESIYVSKCNNISILYVQTKLIRLIDSDYNTLSHSAIALILENSRHNIIAGNSLSLALDESSVGNLIFENNIFRLHYAGESGYCPLTTWDNGSVGNYWSDYRAKYPSASEIGDTGIANTPYVIDENNVDNYPLIRPVSVKQEAEPSTLDSQETAPFPVAIVAGLSAILIAGAIAGIVYQKKHRQERQADNRIVATYKSALLLLS